MRCKIVIAILLILVLSALPGQAQQVYRVGTEGGYPPFNFVKNGEPCGFDIDIARALCAAMGASCTIVLSTWDEIIPRLVKGEYDFVVASMAKTAQRDMLVDFTIPYYRSRTNFIGNPRELLASTPKSLAGKTIATQKETVQAEYLKANYAKDSKLLLLNTLIEAFHALVEGRADAVLTDSLVGYEFLQNEVGQPFDYIGPPLTTKNPSSEACIAVREGDDVLRIRLEKALQTIRLNGVYERINREYFPFSIY